MYQLRPTVAQPYALIDVLALLGTPLPILLSNRCCIKAIVSSISSQQDERQTSTLSTGSLASSHFRPGSHHPEQKGRKVLPRMAGMTREDIEPGPDSALFVAIFAKYGSTIRVGHRSGWLSALSSSSSAYAWASCPCSPPYA